MACGYCRHWRAPNYNDPEPYEEQTGECRLQATPAKTKRFYGCSHLQEKETGLIGVFIYNTIVRAKLNKNEAARRIDLEKKLKAANRTIKELRATRKPKTPEGA